MHQGERHGKAEEIRVVISPAAHHGDQCPGGAARGLAYKPAIVLAAFGTSATAFDTYSHFEQKVRERFPGYEIRWAFTSHKVRHKLAQEKGHQLNDLPTTFRELKAAGFNRVAIQSLHIVPGEEWDKKIVQESRKIPGPQSRPGKAAAEQPTGSGASPPGRGPDLSQGFKGYGGGLDGPWQPRPGGGKRLYRL